MDLQNRNHYNEEFKRKAVLHYIENHGTLAGSATQFGITAGMLSKWIDRYAPSNSADEAVGSMNYEVEIRRLQSELKVLKEIVGKALLQKASDDKIVQKMVNEPETFFQ